LEERKQQLQKAWESAAQAMAHAQSLWHKTSGYCPYQKGKKVWLDGTNLHTSHPMQKLCPKRFRPFKIMEQLSLVTYQLDLPQNWLLHNVFHAMLLSLYHETREHGASYSTLAPEYKGQSPQSCHNKESD